MEARQAVEAVEAVEARQAVEAVACWRYPPTGNTRRRGAGVKGEGISQHL